MLRLHQLLKRLREEGDRTTAAFAGLTPEQWASVIYADGHPWHARDLLAHLLSTERSIQNLLRNVLAGGPGAPPDFDIDAFNQAEVIRLHGRAPADLLAEFTSARADTLTLVSALHTADLDRIGRHPFLGETTLEDILKLLYRHTMLHLRDLRQALTSPMTRLDQLRHHLTDEFNQAHAIFSALTEAQWLTPIPSDAEAPWTARDALAHVLVSDTGQFTLAQRIAAGGEGAPADFDLHRYNRSSVKKRADTPPAQLLANIADNHAAILAWLNTLTTADLDKTGRHAAGDVLTVEGFLRRLSAHRLSHARDIQAAIQG